MDFGSGASSSGSAVSAGSSGAAGVGSFGAGVSGVAGVSAGAFSSGGLGCSSSMTTVGWRSTSVLLISMRLTG